MSWLRVVACGVFSQTLIEDSAVLIAVRAAVPPTILDACSDHWTFTRLDSASALDCSRCHASRDRLSRLLAAPLSFNGPRTSSYAQDRSTHAVARKYRQQDGPLRIRRL